MYLKSEYPALYSLLGIKPTLSSGGVWTTRYTTSTTVNIRGITYGNNLYVAVGSNGCILTSSDAITWNELPSTGTFSLISVTYGNGKFVAVGGFGFLSLSTDGLDWTRLTNTSTNSNVGVTSNEIAEFFLLNSVGSISRSSIGYNVLTDFVAPYIKTNSVRAYYRASM